MHPLENKSFLPVCILRIYSLSKLVPVASINHEGICNAKLGTDSVQKFIYTIDGGSSPLQLMYALHSKTSKHVHMENDG